jgi:hypothetical protein
LLTSTYSTYTGATLTAINGKLASAGCASDSAKFNNILPAGYLLSGATAKNSLCLGGNLANTFAPINAPTFTGTVGGITAAMVGALATAGTAADSSKLGGVLPAGYLLSGGTAKNSLCLGGALANTFAPLASPVFTTCATLPTPFKIGAVQVNTTGTELNYVCGVTSAIQTQLGTKAPLASPAFTTNACSPIFIENGTCLANTYASKTNAVTGATNLGGAYTCISTTVSSNKINLKGLKGVGGLSISNDSNYITLSATTVTVSGATTDVFANVSDTYLMARNGTAITGVTQTKFVTPATLTTTLTGTQLLLGCAGSSNGNGVRIAASRVTIVNRPTAPVVGLNAACSLSVTQVFEAGIIGYSASAARNLTLPTACGASGLVQALPCAAVGDVFQMTVYNTCTFAVTLLGGTNTTIVNTNTITCVNSPRLLNFRVTAITNNAETISVY